MKPSRLTLKGKLAVQKLQIDSLKRGALAMRDMVLMFGQHLPDCCVHKDMGCTCGWAVSYGALKDEETFASILPQVSH